MPAVECGDSVVTVLVADDSPEVLSLTRQTLEGAGYRVLTARDGLEGVLEFCRHDEEIRVVVLDAMMPQVDGVEAFKAIRSIRSETKVILSTGHDHFDTPDRWLGIGFSGFLKKPYGPRELVQRVREAAAT
jgi:two-component system, cell cycle sensor histidine kinase and response regulator CckA